MKSDPDPARPSATVDEWIDDDAFERADAERKRKRRRALWWLCGGVAAMFALFAAAVVYSDAPEPEVSDLMPVPRASIPDEENFYAQLLKVASSLGREGIVPGDEPNDLPEGDARRMPGWSSSSADSYWGFPDFLAAGRGWTSERLARWDVALAEFAEACDRLPALPGSLAPMPGSTTELYADHGLWMFEGQLAAAAGMYWQAGDRDRAVAILATLYRCGTRLKHTEGSLILTYRRGQTMQRSAIRNWERFAQADADTAEVIARLWPKLREPDDGDVFRSAIRGEYRNMTLVVAENDGASVRSGIGHGCGGMPHPTLFAWLARSRVLFPLVYKPRLTKTVYAEHVRTMMEWSDLTGTEFKKRGGVELLDLEERDLFQPANLWGKALLMLSDVTRGAVNSRNDYRSRVSLFEAAVALRRHHARHGRLPETLAELTPDFLDGAPVDYVDGASLRYSKADYAIWSIGRPDLGVTNSVHPPQAADVVRLDFAAPAVAAALATGDREEVKP